MLVRPLSSELAEKARLELSEDPKRLQDGLQHIKDWIAKQPHLRARTVRPLSSELAEKARLELSEDPKRLQDGLQHIKDWIAKQPHLRARTDDQWLAAFLRGCKFSLERAKQKLDLYYTVRNMIPEFCSLKCSDPIYTEFIESGCILFLPKLSAPDAPRVVIMRIGQLDPDKFKFSDMMCILQDLNKILYMEDDNAVVSGIQSISDLKGASMNHFLQVTPTSMKKMSVFGQDASPIRMKGAYYLNMSSAFETVVNTFKPLMNEKTRNRMHFYGDNWEELYKQIPKRILPAEYGGEGGTIKEIIDYWKKKIEEYGPWLEEDRQFGTDESKRPGKPKTAEDLFGIDGSFRQLEFD